MKKIFLFALPTLFLFACGSEETTSDSNSNESSLVAVENPIGDNTANNTVSLNEKETPVGPTTSIEFMESEFNFDNVFYPSENMHTFKFKNTGNVPLTIISATASCGCTIPNKPEEPILPGEIGELDVIFRPKEGQAGTHVTKKITVVANTEPKETYLQIEAEVLKSI